MITRLATSLCLGTSLAALTLCASTTPAGAAIYTAADVVAAAPAALPVSFDVMLPLRNTAALDALLARLQDPTSADFHKWLTPQTFGAQFGPDAASLRAVAAALRAAGFSVAPHTRSLRVTGTVDAVQRTFAAKLSLVRGPASAKPQPVALSGLRLPPALQAAGATIVAFSPHRSELHPAAHSLGAAPANRYGRANLAYWYDDLRQAYGYPAVNAMVTAHDGTQKPLNGSGVTLVAMMASDMLDSDIALMFAHENYSATTGQPAPVLAGRRYVAGAVPGQLNDNAFYESSIDTQEELGGAPGASVVLYDIATFGDDSITAGYVDIDEDNSADIANASIVGDELAYTPAFNGGTDYTGILRAYDELLKQGNAQGITFLVSSGDHAGRESPSPNYVTGAPGPVTFIPSVSFLTGSAAMTDVGGTNLVTVSVKGSLTSAYLKENSYGDPEVAQDPFGLGVPVYGGYWGAGGGVSAVFAKPAFQSALAPGVANRLVPDIGMMVGGCPFGLAKLPCNGGDRPIDGNGNTDRSYGLIAVGGTFYGYIGTSLSSPEFASALALRVEMQGRQGNINPYLYATAAAQKAGSASPALHRGIPGFNGVVPNRVPGMNYNYMVGIGTPHVATLMGVPAGTPLAGLPQTPSNP